MTLAALLAFVLRDPDAILLCAVSLREQLGNLEMQHLM